MNNNNNNNNNNILRFLQVRFRRGGLKTQIEVDGVRDSKSYEVSCGQMTSLVFGGVSPHDKDVIKSIMVSYSFHV